MICYFYISFGSFLLFVVFFIYHSSVFNFYVGCSLVIDSQSPINEFQSKFLFYQRYVYHRFITTMFAFDGICTRSHHA